MSPSPLAAARAAHFMRQCRMNLQRSPLTLAQVSTRSVSSSHLAPSNFSKQTRRRDDEIRYPGASNSPQSPSAPQSLRNHVLSKQPVPGTSSLASHNANINIPPGFFSFVKYRIFNLQPPAPPAHKPPSFTVLNNPWKAKKTWPPDFDAMHPKQQFHFEKTFRRRMLRKTNSRRYNWNRYVRLLQQSLIIITVMYFVFIADPYAKDGGGTPMDGFRSWFFGQVQKFEHLPEGLRDQAGELEGYYSKNWKKAPWGEGEEGEQNKEMQDIGTSSGSVEAPRG